MEPAELEPAAVRTSVLERPQVVVAVFGPGDDFSGILHNFHHESLLTLLELIDDFCFVYRHNFHLKMTEMMLIHRKKIVNGFQKG